MSARAFLMLPAMGLSSVSSTLVETNTCRVYTTGWHSTIHDQLVALARGLFGLFAFAAKRFCQGMVRLGNLKSGKKKKEKKRKRKQKKGKKGKEKKKKDNRKRN